MMKHTRCHAFRFQVDDPLSNVLALKPLRSRRRRLLNVFGGYVNVVLEEIGLYTFMDKSHDSSY